jgi:RNA polymerase sigma factor (TIGR02999 family)
MADEPMMDATGTLISHTQGDPKATEQLCVLLYDELRRIAGDLMRQERPDHTLQPTALMHEAYMRLIKIERVDWKSKAHFCNMAAKVMRRVLRDYAEYHNAKKRGGHLQKIPLVTNLPLDPNRTTEILALDEAVEKLAELSERPSRVAELRLFGGLLNKDIAHVLGVSERTVVDDWQFARAWLARELTPGRGGV